MLSFDRPVSIQPILSDLVCETQVLQQAASYMDSSIPHITDCQCSRSEGTIHDFYSEGDYWWPNPNTPNGLPFIRKDGQSNPDNFTSHRMILRNMRNQVSTLALAYRLSKDESYADRASLILKEFFVDEATKMNPNLNYAQAIAGVCPGRGIGVIDTIHLADVPFAIEALKESHSMTKNLYNSLQNWFSRYLGWMLSSPNGIEEMNTVNNHCVCYIMQAAVFSLFTDNEQIAEFCRFQYKTRLLSQMNTDGSFPLELSRTKPYNYSAFILDNMASICQLLSTKKDNLWRFETSDHKSYQKALDFLCPYILDKKKWPYPEDVEHFDAFPIRYSFLLFSGYALGKRELIDFFFTLPAEIRDEEALRNLAVRTPALWMV